MPGQSGRRVTLALDCNDVQRARDVFAWSFSQFLCPGDTVQMLVVICKLNPKEMVETSGRQEKERKAASNLVGQFSAFAQMQKINVESYIVEGEPRIVISDMANKLKSNLVVVGHHGDAARERYMLTRFGSVSEACAHSLLCPVVVVKRPHSLVLFGGEEDDGGRNNIGVAVDGSAASSAAFEFTLANLIRVEKDHLFVLHIDTNAATAAEQLAQDNLMLSYANRCEKNCLKYDVIRSRSSSDASAALTVMADALQLRLLVLGGTPRGLGIWRALFGGVSDNVIRNCACDVVIVKAGQEQEQEQEQKKEQEQELQVSPVDTETL